MSGTTISNINNYATCIIQCVCYQTKIIIFGTKYVTEAAESRDCLWSWTHSPTSSPPSSSLTSVWLFLTPGRCSSPSQHSIAVDWTPESSHRPKRNLHKLTMAWIKNLQKLWCPVICIREPEKIQLQNLVPAESF